MSLRGSLALKILDRYAGIPLVFLFGLRPIRRQLPEAPRTVGLLRTAAIGDTLLLSGIMADLRSHWPTCDILLFTGPDNAEAGRLVVRDVGRQVTLPLGNLSRAVTILRRNPVDILIDSGAWPRLDAALAALGRSRLTVGFRTPGQHRHFAYDCIVQHSATVHESENFRALVRAIGVPATAAPALKRDGLPQVTQIRPTKPFVVFHPWSGGFRGWIKEWPAARWVELGRLLAADGVSIVITGARGNATGSKQLVDALRAARVEAINTAGELTLAEVASICCESRGVVSVNTGIMHLAALLGVATVGLDGPSPAHRWGPVGPRAASVSSTLPGCGFLNLGFEYSGSPTDCMLGVDVQDVHRALRSLLEVETERPNIEHRTPGLA